MMPSEKTPALLPEQELEAFATLRPRPEGISGGD